MYTCIGSYLQRKSLALFFFPYELWSWVVGWDGLLFCFLFCNLTLFFSFLTFSYYLSDMLKLL